MSKTSDLTLILLAVILVALQKSHATEVLPAETQQNDFKNTVVATNVAVRERRSPDFVPGLTLEIYSKLDGYMVSDITNSPKYPNSPDQTLQITSLEEQGSGIPDESYGTRIFGFFKPHEDGPHVFYCSSNAEGTFSLSTDDSPTNLVKIAEVIGQQKLHSGEFEKFPNQKSAPITLQKGKMYYLEGLHKQLYGHHHFQVGVVVPSGSRVFPVSQSYIWTKSAHADAASASAKANNTELPIEEAEKAAGKAGHEAGSDAGQAAGRDAGREAGQKAGEEAGKHAGLQAVADALGVPLEELLAQKNKTAESRKYMLKIRLYSANFPCAEPYGHVCKYALSVHQDDYSLHLESREHATTFIVHKPALNGDANSFSLELDDHRGYYVHLDGASFSAKQVINVGSAATSASFVFENKYTDYPDAYGIQLSGGQYFCHAGGTANLVSAGYTRDCTFLAVHIDLDHNSDQHSCVNYCKHEEQEKKKEESAAAEGGKLSEELEAGSDEEAGLEGGGEAEGAAEGAAAGGAAAEGGAEGAEGGAEGGAAEGGAGGKAGGAAAGGSAGSSSSSAGGGKIDVGDLEEEPDDKSPLSNSIQQLLSTAGLHAAAAGAAGANSVGGLSAAGAGATAGLQAAAGAAGLLGLGLYGSKITDQMSLPAKIGLNTGLAAQINPHLALNTINTLSGKLNIQQDAKVQQTAQSQTNVGATSAGATGATGATGAAGGTAGASSSSTSSASASASSSATATATATTIVKYVAVKFINNAQCCVKIISSLGSDKEYPLNAKSLKLKIVFRHKDEKKLTQLVTFEGVDVSGAGRIVKFDGQKSISFRPVLDGDTYITVFVTSVDPEGSKVPEKVSENTNNDDQLIFNDNEQKQGKLIVDDDSGELNIIHSPKVIHHVIKPTKVIGGASPIVVTNMAADLPVNKIVQPVSHKIVRVHDAANVVTGGTTTAAVVLNDALPLYQTHHVKPVIGRPVIVTTEPKVHQQKILTLEPSKIVSAPVKLVKPVQEQILLADESSVVAPTLINSDNSIVHTLHHHPTKPTKAAQAQKIVLVMHQKDLASNFASPTVSPATVSSATNLPTANTKPTTPHFTLKPFQTTTPTKAAQFDGINHINIVICPAPCVGRCAGNCPQECCDAQASKQNGGQNGGQSTVVCQRPCIDKCTSDCPAPCCKVSPAQMAAAQNSDSHSVTFTQPQSAVSQSYPPQAQPEARPAATNQPPKAPTQPAAESTQADLPYQSSVSSVSQSQLCQQNPASSFCTNQNTGEGVIVSEGRVIIHPNGQVVPAKKGLQSNGNTKIKIELVSPESDDKRKASEIKGIKKQTLSRRHKKHRLKHKRKSLAKKTHRKASLKRLATQMASLKATIPRPERKSKLRKAKKLKYTLPVTTKAVGHIGEGLRRPKHNKKSSSKVKRFRRSCECQTVCKKSGISTPETNGCITSCTGCPGTPAKYRKDELLHPNGHKKTISEKDIIHTDSDVGDEEELIDYVDDDDNNAETGTKKSEPAKPDGNGRAVSEETASSNGRVSGMRNFINGKGNLVDNALDEVEEIEDITDNDGDDDNGGKREEEKVEIVGDDGGSGKNGSKGQVEAKKKTLKVEGKDDGENVAVTEYVNDDDRIAEGKDILKHMNKTIHMNDTNSEGSEEEKVEFVNLDDKEKTTNKPSNKSIKDYVKQNKTEIQEFVDVQVPDNHDDYLADSSEENEKTHGMFHKGRTRHINKANESIQSYNKTEEYIDNMIAESSKHHESPEAMTLKSYDYPLEAPPSVYEEPPKVTVLSLKGPDSDSERLDDNSKVDADDGVDSLEGDANDNDADFGASESVGKGKNTGNRVSEGNTKGKPTASGGSIKGKDARMGASESSIKGNDAGRGASDSNTKGSNAATNASMANSKSKDNAVGASEGNSKGNDATKSASKSNSKGSDVAELASASSSKSKDADKGASESNNKNKNTEMGAKESATKGKNTAQGVSENISKGKNAEKNALGSNTKNKNTEMSASESIAKGKDTAQVSESLSNNKNTGKGASDRITKGEGITQGASESISESKSAGKNALESNKNKDTKMGSSEIKSNAEVSGKAASNGNIKDNGKVASEASTKNKDVGQAISESNTNRNDAGKSKSHGKATVDNANLKNEQNSLKFQEKTITEVVDLDDQKSTKASGNVASSSLNKKEPSVGSESKAFAKIDSKTESSVKEKEHINKTHSGKLQDVEKAYADIGNSTGDGDEGETGKAVPEKTSKERVNNGNEDDSLKVKETGRAGQEEKTAGQKEEAQKDGQQKGKGEQGEDKENRKKEGGQKAFGKTTDDGQSDLGNDDNGPQSDFTSDKPTSILHNFNHASSNDEEADEQQDKSSDPLGSFALETKIKSAKNTKGTTTNVIYDSYEGSVREDDVHDPPIFVNLPMKSAQGFNSDSTDEDEVKAFSKTGEQTGDSADKSRHSKGEGASINGIGNIGVDVDKQKSGNKEKDEGVEKEDMDKKKEENKNENKKQGKTEVKEEEKNKKVEENKNRNKDQGKTGIKELVGNENKKGDDDKRKEKDNNQNKEGNNERNKGQGKTGMKENKDKNEEVSKIKKEGADNKDKEKDIEGKNKGNDARKIGQKTDKRTQDENVKVVSTNKNTEKNMGSVRNKDTKAENRGKKKEDAKNENKNVHEEESNKNPETAYKELSSDNESDDEFDTEFNPVNVFKDVDAKGDSIELEKDDPTGSIMTMTVDEDSQKNDNPDSDDNHGFTDSDAGEQMSDALNKPINSDESDYSEQDAIDADKEAIETYNKVHGKDEMNLDELGKILDDLDKSVGELGTRNKTVGGETQNFLNVTNDGDDSNEDVNDENEEKGDDEGSKKSNQGSKTSNEGSKTNNEETKTNREGSKTNNEENKINREGSKTNSSGSKKDNEGSKTRSEEGKTNSQGSKTTNEGTKTSNEGSKMNTEGNSAGKGQKANQRLSESIKSRTSNKGNRTEVKGKNQENFNEKSKTKGSTEQSLITNDVMVGSDSADLSNDSDDEAIEVVEPNDVLLYTKDADSQGGDWFEQVIDKSKKPEKEFIMASKGGRGDSEVVNEENEGDDNDGNVGDAEEEFGSMKKDGMNNVEDADHFDDNDDDSVDELDAGDQVAEDYNSPGSKAKSGLTKTDMDDAKQSFLTQVEGQDNTLSKVQLNAIGKALNRDDETEFDTRHRNKDLYDSSDELAELAKNAHQNSKDSMSVIANVINEQNKIEGRKSFPQDGSTEMFFPQDEDTGTDTEATTTDNESAMTENEAPKIDNEAVVDDSEATVNDNEAGDKDSEGLDSRYVDTGNKKSSLALGSKPLSKSNSKQKHLSKLVRQHVVAKSLNMSKAERSEEERHRGNEFVNYPMLYFPERGKEEKKGNAKINRSKKLRPNFKNSKFSDGKKNKRKEQQGANHSNNKIKDQGMRKHGLKLSKLVNAARKGRKSDSKISNKSKFSESLNMIDAMEKQIEKELNEDDVTKRNKSMSDVSEFSKNNDDHDNDDHDNNNHDSTAIDLKSMMPEYKYSGEVPGYVTVKRVDGPKKHDVNTKLRSNLLTDMNKEDHTDRLQQAKALLQMQKYEADHALDEVKNLQSSSFSNVLQQSMARQSAFVNKIANNYEHEYYSPQNGGNGVEDGSPKSLDSDVPDLDAGNLEKTGEGEGKIVAEKEDDSSKEIVQKDGITEIAQDEPDDDNTSLNRNIVLVNNDEDNDDENKLETEDDDDERISEVKNSFMHNSEDDDDDDDEDEDDNNDNEEDEE